MPSSHLPPRHLVLALTLVVAWFASSPEPLCAGKQRQPAPTESRQQVRVSQRGASHLVNLQAVIDDQGDLPTPAEDLNPPPASPDSPASPHAIATDRPSHSPNPNRTSPPRPASFVAAPMSTLSVDVSLPTGLLPQNVARQSAAATQSATTTQSATATESDSRLHGNWALTQHGWSATRQCHLPLYFEETNAERYGYTPAYLLQPFLSAGHFFLTIPILPYKMAVDCPRKCVYTLGQYRPGSRVPRRRNRLPRQASAAIVQAGVVAGLTLLIP